MPILKSLLVDLFLVALATVAAAVTRDNFEIIAPRLLALVPYLAITLSVAGFVLPAFGVSRSLWQFTSMRDGLRIVGATVMIVLGAITVGFVVNRLDGIARALPIIQGLLIVSFLVGARVLTCVSHNRRFRSAATHHSDGAETVLVIGLNKLAELYLQCLAEFDTGRVRIAGLLGEGSRVGLSVHSHPVLGTHEEIASTLRRLELHGVFVDRILVAAPRDDLSVPVREALSQIQETTTIDIEYLAERIGIQSPPRVRQPPKPPRMKQSVLRLRRSIKLLSKCRINEQSGRLTWSLRPYCWSPWHHSFCSLASLLRRMWACRWYSGNSGRACKDGHLSFTNFARWLMLTILRVNGNLTTHGLPPSAPS